MSRQRATMHATALSILCVATALAASPKVRIDFGKLLPDGWIVVSVDTAATAPYGWAHDRENPGMAIRVEGPTEVNNRGVRQEGVTLCFMPPDYVPGEMQDVQLTGSTFLGRTDAFQLYLHVWPSPPTWKSCRDDIAKHFGVKMPNKAVEGTTHRPPGVLRVAPHR